MKEHLGSSLNDDGVGVCVKAKNYAQGCDAWSLDETQMKNGGKCTGHSMADHHEEEDLQKERQKL